MCGNTKTRHGLAQRIGVYQNGKNAGNTSTGCTTPNCLSFLSSFVSSLGEEACSLGVEGPQCRSYAVTKKTVFQWSLLRTARKWQDNLRPIRKCWELLVFVTLVCAASSVAETYGDLPGVVPNIGRNSD